LKPSFGKVILAILTVSAIGASLGIAIGRDRAPGASVAATPVASSSAASASPGSPMATEPSVDPEPKKETLVIRAAGDTSLDPVWIPTLRSQGWDYAWSGLDGIFETDDLSIVNLECPVANPGTGSKIDKEFNFLCDPRGLPAMRRAGVEVASLANNHAYDYGAEALLASVKNIAEARITPIGAGEDADAAEEPAIFDIKGWKIAVLPWDYVVDPWPTAVAAPGHPGTAFGHDFNAVVKAVKRVDRKVDLTVVQTHWGVELETRPNAAQVPLGHRLIDAGADIIFGGHSHRMQPLEIYQGKPIFWSLGNFVWPNNSVASATSGVAEVTVKPNGRIKAKLLPAYITAPGHPELR